MTGSRFHRVLVEVLEDISKCEGDVAGDECGVVFHPLGFTDEAAIGLLEFFEAVDECDAPIAWSFGSVDDGLVVEVECAAGGVEVVVESPASLFGFDGSDAGIFVEGEIVRDPVPCGLDARIVFGESCVEVAFESCVGHGSVGAEDSRAVGSGGFAGKAFAGAVVAGSVDESAVIAGPGLVVGFAPVLLSL